jgi:hypothetical protein
MKRFGVLVTGALLVILVVAPVYGQQPETASDPHHPAMPGTAPVTPSLSTPGAKAGDMPMMDMCRQMMAGDMMAGPMMGGPAPADPKEKAHMLEMRGEMMKAMGDIMMKHAQRMQGGKAN